MGNLPVQSTSTEKERRPEISKKASLPAKDSVEEFPVVGIGASAGGLAAFEQLFLSLPPDSGMAFVVVQHLSAPHKSILSEILQRYTTMPVTQVTEGIKVKPNGVYVIPPGSDLALKDGHLTLLKPDTARGYRLPIDFFFRSLAQDQGDRSIGIVLSGTGSDGSTGLKNIKSEGGLTIAQEPTTAEYADMPRNAIATRDVDFIVPPQKIGELILKYHRHQTLDGYKRLESDIQIPSSGLQKLFYLLRSKTGHDFSLYKQNTLLRRIERRMKICLVKSIEEYIDRLDEHPEEIQDLFQEMLINVTHFFRDPEAFNALSLKAINPLVSLKQIKDDPLRVWVAGCSSGEEAYSIAIVIQEQLETLKTDCKVQIYATDLDGDAIDTARRGFFRDGSLENVSPERLQRFFYQEEDGYRIRKNLRDMVVFSTQNLISDPPFSRIDLLCCRNLLIYLERELQNHLFLQFHYSLKPDGILFLGNSESISGNTDLFTVIDRKYKIFQRKDTVTDHRHKSRAKLMPRRNLPFDLGSHVDRREEGGLREWMEKELLEFHTPACVIVDQKHDILFIHGRTGKYLEPVPGEANSNLIRMAREGLKTELATAIHASVDQKKEIRREGVMVKTNGDFQAINLTIRPLKAPPTFGDPIMVVFEEIVGVHPGEAAHVEIDREKEEARSSTNRRVIKLQKELKEKDEHLHTIIDELEDANQDLKSSNEELQSTNEEMQSTNEELETSKEELQSINEELSTINTELQNKNEELTGVNNDIYNLLSSIEIGTIFLDLNLNIRRFTPAINRIYNFLSGDIGRPIAHFVSTLEYDDLVKDVKQVLRNLVPKAVEVRTKDGGWYLVNIRPYRTLENLIDGAVITFIDISEQKQENKLRLLGTLLRDSNDAVTLQDFSGKILAWNRGATLLYGWTETEALSLNVMEMIPENKRAEFTELTKRLTRGETVDSYETQRLTRAGKILDIGMTLTALLDDKNLPVGIASTERDITGRNQDSGTFFYENRALKALNAWYLTMLDSPPSTPKMLAEKACQVLVEEAGYQMAWMGKVDKTGMKTAAPIAWAGFGNDQRELLSENMQEEITRALGFNKPVAISRQPAGRADGNTNPRYESSLVLPILTEKQPKGIMTIYAVEREAFTAPVIGTLTEFSIRVARAIDNLI